MKQSIKINEIFLIKILTVLLFLYINIIGLYVNVNRALLMIGIPLAALMLIFSIRKSISVNVLLPTEMKLYLLFFLFALVSGLFIAINKTVLVRSLFTYLQTLVLMVCLLVIAHYDKNLEFLEILIVLTAFVMAVVVLSSVSNIQDALSARQTLYRGSIRTINPNSVGLAQNAAFFIHVVWMRRIIKKNRSKTSMLFKQVGFLVLIFLMGITLLTIFITGSRKSLLASVVVVFLAFVFFPQKGVIKRILSVVGSGLLIIGIVWIGERFIDKFYMFSRFQNFFTEGSNTTRFNMIREGIDLLGSSPFVGVGFANYTYASSFNTYSHNTVAEALATTGLIGATIYFLTYLTILLKLLILKRNKTSFEFATNGLVLLGTLVFTSIGIIHFYGILSALLFTYLIAGINLYLPQMRK